MTGQAISRLIIESQQNNLLNLKVLFIWEIGQMKTGEIKKKLAKMEELHSGGAGRDRFCFHPEEVGKLVLQGLTWELAVLKVRLVIV